MCNHEEIIAEQFFNHYLQNEEFPLDLSYIALAVEKELAIEVFFEECILPVEITAQLRKGHHAALIYVNQNHSLTRRRFAVAHEFGHLLLGHRDGIPSPGLGESDLEFESANNFAAALLMPECHMLDRIKLYPENSGIVSDVARHFGVGLDVAARRLASLDYLPVLFALVDTSINQIEWEYHSTSFCFDREGFSRFLQEYFHGIKKSDRLIRWNEYTMSFERHFSEHKCLMVFSPQTELKSLCAKERSANYSILKTWSAK